ncbi:winged helix-turn-helix domain-containing protein [Rouxiella sp. Mn2063]|uniref:winged helix-turn-helix domain-containing protein n=1 Tax=Rouxiella sp. Mn2063 TaxID=3395262 RepID=UPI003BD305C1
MDELDERNGYLLSSNVEFWPTKLELYRRDIKKTFKLQYPASCCLLELVRKQPMIVSQSELMETGWADRKEYVTANAYYQCILNLRKALEDAGLDSHFIRTVHRRGLRIAPNVKIKSIIQTPLKMDIENKEEETVPSIKEIVPIETSSQPMASIKSNKKITPFILFLSIFIIFILSVFITPQVYKRNQYYNFDDYIQITNIGDCPVYVNSTLLDKASFERFIKYNDISCGEKTWWYITRYPSSPRSSLIRCLRPLTGDKKTSCTTDYYYGLRNYD